MKNKNNEEKIILNESNKYLFEIKQKLDNFIQKINSRLFIFIFLIFINNILFLFIYPKKVYINHNKEINIERKAYNNKMYIYPADYLQHQLRKEKHRPILKEINKKRTFEKRFPLPKEINWKAHLLLDEIIAFLSFLTKDTVYFETGSGCSSLIAKYYTKKSYAVEGCKQWYEEGVKNGLKNNLIFRDLKVDNPIWSYPGNKSNIDDWKKYFQAYDKRYNADIILIDGRFKIATAMDLFDKIRDDTIVFIHEYQDRPSYFILENYYQYVYHWGTLMAFVKKKDVKSIPLEIQKKYLDKFLWKNWTKKINISIKNILI